MNNRRGDVILLDYPFSDSTGMKVRPAVVVQENRRNAILTHTIVAMITKNVLRVATDPSQLLIDITTPDGRRSGLRVNSAVTCGNLFTVHEKHVIATIGNLSTALLRKMDDCLKAALGLP